MSPGMAVSRVTPRPSLCGAEAAQSRHTMQMRRGECAITMRRG